MTVSASGKARASRVWQAGLQEDDELAGMGWDWQSVDSSTVKAPFAQAAVGPAPTDRGKQGTKRSLLCDRRGIPLALVIEGANRHDVLRGYEPHARLNPPKHQWYWEATKQSPPAPEPANRLEATKQPRRWVGERLFSWLNRSRRLLIRWEKLSAPYEAFLTLACALIGFHQSDRLSVFG